MADPRGESSGLDSSELNDDSGEFHEVSLMPTRNLQLVPHPHAKSSIWTHFGFKAKSDGNVADWKKVVCCACNQQLAYSGNTSNLTYHLSKLHPNIMAEVKTKRSVAKMVPVKVLQKGPKRPSSILWLQIRYSTQILVTKNWLMLLHISFVWICSQ